MNYYNGPQQWSKALQVDDVLGSFEKGKTTGCIFSYSRTKTFLLSLEEMYCEKICTPLSAGNPFLRKGGDPLPMNRSFETFTPHESISCKIAKLFISPKSWMCKER
jgi:hypothetical protein